MRLRVQLAVSEKQEVQGNDRLRRTENMAPGMHTTLAW